MSINQSQLSFEVAEQSFQKAWENPSNTRFEFPPIDVNSVISHRYTTREPFALTLDQLWDMEAKKSWNPKRYIPYVVSSGESWGRQQIDAASEHFTRLSVQKAWIDNDEGTVLEEVSVNHRQRRIIFLGRQAVTRDGRLLKADNFQPIFHVEHSAAGTDNRPLNIWKVVFLTDRPEPNLLRPFQEMQAAGWLPGFLESYIRDDLGKELQRRPQPA